MQRKLLEINNVELEAAGPLMIFIHCAFVKYLRKKWECKEAIQQVFIQFKKDYESVTS